MNPVVIIQARTGSTRLPRKVLMDIAGRPMLAHVVERARAIRGISGVVVATTDKIADDRVVTLCNSLVVPVFRGSESDVLDRFYECAVTFHADPIIRVTGDCPLLDPEESSRVLEAYLLSCDARGRPGYHYVSNVGPGTDGLDTEVVSFGWLKNAWKRASDPYDREHVTPWITRTLRGRLGHALHVQTRTLDAKLSVDTEDDLERVRAVVIA